MGKNSLGHTLIIQINQYCQLLYLLINIKNIMQLAGCSSCIECNPPLTDRHLLNKMCCSKRKEDPDRRGVFICTNLIPCPHEQAPEIKQILVGHG